MDIIVKLDENYFILIVYNQTNLLFKVIDLHEKNNYKFRIIIILINLMTLNLKREIRKFLCMTYDAKILQHKCDRISRK